MDLLSQSPPKHQLGKAPSIFSPEWNEKSSSMPSNNGSNLLSGIDHGANGSESLNAMPSLSPKKEYDKRAMSDMIKKEKLDIKMEQPHSRTSMQTDKSANVKREPVGNIAGAAYDADFKRLKRMFDADVSGDLDGSEYGSSRGMKIRRTEQLSPIQNVSELAKSAMSSKSLASVNGIDSKPMESPNSDKYGKVGEYAKGSGNAVPITTDLVSSLLKESFGDNVNKYGATLDAPQKKPQPSASAVKQQPDHSLMPGYNMPQHQMIDAREPIQPIQPHSIKTEESDRTQTNQFMNQNPQFRMDQKRMQVPPAPTAMSGQPPQMPPSKGIAPMTEDQQFNELQQQSQQQQKTSQLHQGESNQNVYGAQTLPPQLQVKSDSDQRIKSEKKKKKEKHKNKDKEKSKNREERKKHKKDKDRHKEKGKSHSSGHESSQHDAPTVPLKIKLSLSAAEPSSMYDSHASIHNESTMASALHPPQGDNLKLKITRDRIKPDLESSGNENKSMQIAPMASATTSTSTSLKIKIPKQVVGNYNSGGTNTYNSQQMHSNELGHSQNPSGGSGSSKKKDRNRDREKSMRNPANLSNPTKVIINYSKAIPPCHSYN